MDELFLNLFLIYLAQPPTFQLPSPSNTLSCAHLHFTRLLSTVYTYRKRTLRQSIASDAG